MIEIKSENKQDGRNLIEEYIKRYWNCKSSITPNNVDVADGIYNNKPYVSGSLCDTCIHANVCRFEVTRGEACEDYIINPEFMNRGS